MAELSPERRILLAFAISFVVLTLWSVWFRSKYAPPPVRPEPAPVTAPAPAETQPAAAKEAPPRGAAPAGEIKQGGEERLLTVETDSATIVFSTRGAVVRSWTLKNFHDDAGKPLELVQSEHTGLGWPLSLSLPTAKDEQVLNNALFVVNSAESRLTAPAELVFEWSDGRLAARKSFRFAGGYLAEVETSLTENGRPVPHRLAWRGGFGEHASQTPVARGTEAQVFVRTPAGLKRQPGRVAGQTTGWLWKSPSPFPYSGEAAYAGIEDRYFAAVFLPRQPQLDVAAWTQEWTPPEQKPQPVGAVAMGAPNGKLDLFVGPKAIAVLETLEPPALASGARPRPSEELVDFGFFWWVAKPLFQGMKWMYRHWIPNYGWVIILLTVIINTLLFPLKWKSMTSAWEMQKIAPQVRAIQERYKKYRFNDPHKQQMQSEIMGLYKEHGVNPIGGCLPLALQLPFFYGFYKVLYTAIELRQAPWFGWVHDLSAKDPYYILPLVMGLTMFVSTRMTPMAAGDPVQQKMMQYLFPGLFTFMFLNVSSGLVLYWLMSSVVGIGQQWWMNKHQRRRELEEKLAAKERKKKKRHGELPEGEP